MISSDYISDDESLPSEKDSSEFEPSEDASVLSSSSESDFESAGDSDSFRDEDVSDFEDGKKKGGAGRMRTQKKTFSRRPPPRTEIKGKGPSFEEDKSDGETQKRIPMTQSKT